MIRVIRLAMIYITKGWNLFLLFGILLTCTAHGQASPAYKRTGKTAPYVPTSIAKDGLLYCINRQGEVLVLKAAPTYELPAVR